MTDDLLAVARSLVTDRTCLIISAWVCVAALVLAAALIRVSQKLFVFVTCFDIKKIKIHSSCEIEDFVETHLCKLCVILRSRALRVVCPHEGYRSATPLTATV